MQTFRQPRNRPANSSFAIWFTGLPASGKTTLAQAFAAKLRARGLRVEVLDSDLVRERLTPEPAYTPEERDIFYHALAFMAELLTRNGVNVLIAATGSQRRYRDEARRHIRRFAEVYVVCAPDVCRARDPKGLWRRADKGDIERLPGAGAPYEAPEAPEAEVDTAELSVDDAAAEVWRQLAAHGFFAPDDS